MKAVQLLKLTGGVLNLDSENEQTINSVELSDVNTVAQFDKISIQQLKKNKSAPTKLGTVTVCVINSNLNIQNPSVETTIKHLDLDASAETDHNIKFDIVNIPYVSWDSELCAAMEGIDSSNINSDQNSVNAMPFVGQIASVPFHVSFDSTTVPFHDFIAAHHKRNFLSKSNLQLNNRLSSMYIKSLDRESVHTFQSEEQQLHNIHPSIAVNANTTNSVNPITQVNASTNSSIAMNGWSEDEKVCICSEMTLDKLYVSLIIYRFYSAILQK